MKKNLLKIAMILCFFLLILNPSNSIAAATRGLTLWAKSIVPSLFPAVIISSLLIEINAAALTARLIYPFTRGLLGISLEGTYCFLMGVMCGYPMGSKTIAEMMKKNGTMSLLQAQSLFAICAFPSPMFLVGYIATDTLKHAIPVWALLVCIYLPVIFLKTIADFVYLSHLDGNINVFRIFRKKSGAWKIIIRNLPFLAKRYQLNQTRLIRFEAVDQIVSESAILMLRIGGYMMLFSILSSWFLLYLHDFPIFALLLGGCCEMTVGIHQLFQYTGNSLSGLQTALPVMCFFLSFGGLSTVAQTSCVIQDTSLKLSHYICFKLLHGLLSGLLMWGYLQIWGIG